MAKSAIRNWQGKVPDGQWKCQCGYETTDLQEAANHSNDHQEWIHLFEPGNKEPTFEMHPSDVDGVYLNKCPD